MSESIYGITDIYDVRLKKEVFMARSYNKLWHKLIDLSMSKGEMRRATGITTNALAKLGKNESVPLETLEKICIVLKCGLDDIVEYVPDEMTTKPEESDRRKDSRL